MRPIRIPQFLLLTCLLLGATDDTSPGPHYAANGALLLPAGYREWVFLSSGLDMSYSDADGDGSFDVRQRVRRSGGVERRSSAPATGPTRPCSSRGARREQQGLDPQERATTSPTR